MNKGTWQTPRLRELSDAEIEQNPEMKKAVAELKEAAAKAESRRRDQRWTWLALMATVVVGVLVWTGLLSVIFI